MSRTVKASAFIECSAISGENLQQVFNVAAKEAVRAYNSKEKQIKCAIS